MDTRKPNRRKFLSQTFTRGTVAGAAALGLPALAAAKKRPEKKAITLDGKPVSPKAIFSPVIQFGDLLFVSGAGAHNPKTHKVEPGPFPDQARQCLENVKSYLEAAGSSIDRALKCTVFLTDITQYGPMNEVYHSFFTTNPPARSTVAVKELPGDSPIEIECIAYV
jgi:2-iminobutanoate/2-iminopropanoate deaminase